MSSRRGTPEVALRLECRISQLRPWPTEWLAERGYRLSIRLSRSERRQRPNPILSFPQSSKSHTRSFRQREARRAARRCRRTAPFAGLRPWTPRSTLAHVAAEDRTRENRSRDRPTCTPAAQTPTRHI